MTGATGLVEELAVNLKTKMSNIIWLPREIKQARRNGW